MSATGQQDVGVLIVEDESLVALFLEDTLGSLGYRSCGIAGCADEAISAAQAQRPAIALIDIGLRGSRDGIAIASELKDRFGIVVVFLSGSSDAQTRERAQAVRPHGFLSKPCVEHEIATVLRSALRSAAPP